MDWMKLLKTAFPVSFSMVDNVTNLVIGILIYLVGGAIAGALLGLLSGIFIIGILFSLIGSVLGLYCLAGIVLEVLLYTKVLK